MNKRTFSCKSFLFFLFLFVFCKHAFTHFHWALAGCALTSSCYSCTKFSENSGETKENFQNIVEVESTNPTEIFSHFSFAADVNWSSWNRTGKNPCVNFLSYHYQHFLCHDTDNFEIKIIWLQASVARWTSKGSDQKIETRPSLGFLELKWKIEEKVKKRSKRFLVERIRWKNISERRKKYFRPEGGRKFLNANYFCEVEKVLIVDLLKCHRP